MSDSYNQEENSFISLTSFLAAVMSHLTFEVIPSSPDLTKYRSGLYAKKIIEIKEAHSLFLRMKEHDSFSLTMSAKNFVAVKIDGNP